MKFQKRAKSTHPTVVYTRLTVDCSPQMGIHKFCIQFLRPVPVENAFLDVFFKAETEDKNNFCLCFDQVKNNFAHFGAYPNSLNPTKQVCISNIKAMLGIRSLVF